MGITLLDCIHNRRPYPEHLEAVGLMLHIADINVAVSSHVISYSSSSKFNADTCQAPQLDESVEWSDDMRSLFSQM